MRHRILKYVIPFKSVFPFKSRCGFRSFLYFVDFCVVVNKNYHTKQYYLIERKKSTFGNWKFMVQCWRPGLLT